MTLGEEILGKHQNYGGQHFRGGYRGNYRNNNLGKGIVGLGKDSIQ